MNADENIIINGNNYTLSTNNLLSRIKDGVKQFKRTDNNECFIEFQFTQYNQSVWIDYWKCTSVKGTGVVVMKDFLTYLLNNKTQPINIMRTTIIQAYAVASAIPNPRVTDRSQEKLVDFYKKIGFNVVENKGGFTKVSGTIENIIEKITNHSGGKFRKTKRRKTKRRKTKRRMYTNRRK
jgi:hypothetical protein